MRAGLPLPARGAGHRGGRLANRQRHPLRQRALDRVLGPGSARAPALRDDPLAGRTYERPGAALRDRAGRAHRPEGGQGRRAAAADRQRRAARVQPRPADRATAAAARQLRRRPQVRRGADDAHRRPDHGFPRRRRRPAARGRDLLLDQRPEGPDQRPARLGRAGHALPDVADDAEDRGRHRRRARLHRLPDHDLAPRLRLRTPRPALGSGGLVASDPARHHGDRRARRVGLHRAGDLGRRLHPQHGQGHRGRRLPHQLPPLVRRGRSAVRLVLPRVRADGARLRGAAVDPAAVVPARRAELAVHQPRGHAAAGHPGPQQPPGGLGRGRGVPRLVDALQQRHPARAGRRAGLTARHLRGGTNAGDAPAAAALPRPDRRRVHPRRDPDRPDRGRALPRRRAAAVQDRAPARQRERLAAGARSGARVRAARARRGVRRSDLRHRAGGDPDPHPGRPESLVVPGTPALPAAVREPAGRLGAAPVPGAADPAVRQHMPGGAAAPRPHPGRRARAEPPPDRHRRAVLPSPGPDADEVDASLRRVRRGGRVDGRVDRAGHEFHRAAVKTQPGRVPGRIAGGRRAGRDRAEHLLVRVPARCPVDERVAVRRRYPALHDPVGGGGDRRDLRVRGERPRAPAGAAGRAGGPEPVAAARFRFARGGLRPGRDRRVRHHGVGDAQPGRQLQPGRGQHRAPVRQELQPFRPRDGRAGRGNQHPARPARAADGPRLHAAAGQLAAAQPGQGQRPHPAWVPHPPDGRQGPARRAAARVHAGQGADVVELPGPGHAGRTVAERVVRTAGKARRRPDRDRHRGRAPAPDVGQPGLRCDHPRGREDPAQPIRAAAGRGHLRLVGHPHQPARPAATDERGAGQHRRQRPHRGRLDRRVGPARPDVRRGPR